MIKKHTYPVNLETLNWVLQQALLGWVRLNLIKSQEVHMNTTTKVF